MSKRPLNIIDALADKNVFGKHFSRSDTWESWKVFLCALFALPMTHEQLAIYTKHTGRTAPSSEPLHEAWLICGRRAGKSFIIACVAIFLSAFRDWRPHLAAGEVGTVMIIAADRKQSRTIMRYCLGLLRAVPMLKQLIEAQTKDTITLRNNIIIEIHTASFRAVRGYTVIAALCDELAFWDKGEDAVDSDVEILTALRPAMATVPGAMLLVASSPHARRGSLWENYRRHYGKENDPVLVWQAATREMNASVPQSLIDNALEEDPHRAGAEYMARFRVDVEALLTREAVEACVTPNIRERPPMSNISYRAFCDPSGGSSDAMTLCIAHYESGKQLVVIDCLREVRPPFSPEAVVQEFSTVLKSYRLGSVTGDKYGGIWPTEQFSKFGIRYEAAEKPKTALYTDLLAYINSRRVELLDHPRMFNQLVGLERRTSRGGRDSIDHAPGQHDDLANTVAGICSGYAGKPTYNLAAMSGIGVDEDDPDGCRAYRVSQFFQHIYNNS